MTTITETTENVGNFLKWSSMADNAVIGLEYLLLDVEKDRRKMLLNEGLTLCEMLEKGTLNLEIEDDNIESHNLVTVLTSKFPAEKEESKTKYNIKELSSKASEFRVFIENMMTNSNEYDTEYVKEIQRFFNEISAPFTYEALVNLHNISASGKRMKAKCTN